MGFRSSHRRAESGGFSSDLAAGAVGVMAIDSLHEKQPSRENHKLNHEGRGEVDELEGFLNFGRRQHWETSQPARHWQTRRVATKFLGQSTAIVSTTYTLPKMGHTDRQLS